MSANRPGRYLTQTSSSYMFQIRLPSTLAPQRPLIRISLRTRRLAEARWLTDTLAVRARLLFNAAISQALRAGKSPLATTGAESSVVAIEASMRIVADIKNRLKDDLALIAAGQPLPARDTGEKPLPLLQPDLEERIKLAAQLAVDAFLMEAAERVRQRAAQELAADSPHTVGKTVAQCVPVTSASPDKTVMQQVVRKRFPLTKRQGPVSSPNKPDAINDTVPAYLQDRRAVLRKRSKLPRFSIIAADYLKLRAIVTPGNMKDVQSASSRISVFLDLIGDHPVDRYEPADLQAFILLMADWPARASLRKRGSARQVLEEARRLGHQPLAEKSVKHGYVAAVRAAMRSGMTSHSYRDPFQDVSLRYPSSLAPSRQTASLNAKQLTTLFRIGTETGHMDAAMLPLLAHLTGRRLSALIYLRGIDIVEKFDNVWVAQPTSLVEIEGRARRVPLKTKASLSFFVLHEFFHRIGFIDWATSRDNQFLFPDLMRLADPSKSASQYMQRLFRKAGIEAGCGEVFHSLRADCIDTLRDHEISMRDCKLQVGHSIGADEHGRYGAKALREVSALTLARLPVRPDVDYSVFETLDFSLLANNHRRKGVRNVMPRGVC